MKSKVGSFFGWLSVILVAAFNLFAAVMKFMPVAPGSEAEAMGQRLGLTPGMDHVLGVLELLIVVLYLVPRTSVVGTVLMVGYMAGALATNLTHGFTNMEALPIYLTFAFIALGAWLRLPEFSDRLLGKRK